MGPESDLGFLSETLGRTEQEHPSYCIWSSSKGPNSPITRLQALFSSSERKAWSSVFLGKLMGPSARSFKLPQPAPQRPPQARPGPGVWSHYHAFSSIIQHGSSPSITLLLEQRTCVPVSLHCTPKYHKPGWRRQTQLLLQTHPASGNSTTGTRE